VIDDVVNGSDSSTSSNSTVVLALDGVLWVLLELERAVALVSNLGEGSADEEGHAGLKALKVEGHFPAFREFFGLPVDFD